MLKQWHSQNTYCHWTQPVLNLKLFISCTHFIYEIQTYHHCKDHLWFITYKTSKTIMHTQLSWSGSWQITYTDLQSLIHLTFSCWKLIKVSVNWKFLKVSFKDLLQDHPEILGNICVLFPFSLRHLAIPLLTSLTVIHNIWSKVMRIKPNSDPALK